MSWRKPVAFGVSSGLLVWSVVWITRQLPARWWARSPAGLNAGVAVFEIGLITAQRTLRRSGSTAVRRPVSPSS